jgi:hypothetical protein
MGKETVREATYYLKGSGLYIMITIISLVKNLSTWSYLLKKRWER